MLYLMTVVFIISVANIGTSSEQQRSKRNAINNPCQNGGTFTQNDGCFTCTCADGWAGALCNEVDGNKEERTVQELMWQPGCVMLLSR
uniref:EGF-like domain-containing protein n=1 Tax=Magallana gigas TaxID=29159 RepID=A0A8W8MQD9_MAGGI